MDKDTAKKVLTGLIERFDRSTSDVFLTTIDVEALRTIVDGNEVTDIPQTPSNDARNELSSIAELQFPDWGEIDDDLIMCLDFGTSFSKAFACSTYELKRVPELTGLAFGESGSGVIDILLPSELFLDDSHVFFGASAREKFHNVEATPDRLIGSPKQFITLTKDATELDRVFLDTAQDPSQKLTQRDAVVLYLAHLNLLSERSLAEQGKPINVKRRYTHPHWTDSIFQQNSSAMRRIMAEAVGLSRVLPQHVSGKCSIDVATTMLKRMRDAADNELPYKFIGDPVLEATAAGAGALIATYEGTRASYVILDIGAGTTDVAGCVCVHDPKKDSVTVAEVTSAAKAKNQAGNVLDNALLKHIMKKTQLSDDTTEYKRVRSSLLASIRQNKEVLFTQGSLTVETSIGDVIVIDLEEFLEEPIVQKLFATITNLATEAALVVAGSDNIVNVVVTGGGANLPLVPKLDGRSVEQNGNVVSLRLREAMAEDLQQEYPQYADQYAQLAVAIGGSLPNLPSQVKSIKEGIKAAPPRYMAPMYKS